MITPIRYPKTIPIPKMENRKRTNARSRDARIRRSQKATLKKYENEKLGIFRGSNKKALENAFMLRKIHKMDGDIIKLLFEE